MAKIRIFYTEPVFSEETPVILQKAGYEVFVAKEEIKGVHEFDRESLLATLKEIQPEVLVVGLKFKIDKEVLDSALIKYVFTRSTNTTDHIDCKYCEERGIEIINLKGEELSDVTAVAEACLGGMIQLMRSETPGYEVRGKRLGLWGYGRIARHLEKYAKAHEMDVVYHDPAFLAYSVPIGKLLNDSHIISIHASSIPENKNMVKYEHFEKMAQCPFVLNSTRPWLIEGGSVKKALENGLISGFWADMPVGFEHPKVIIWNKAGNTYESAIKTEIILRNKILKWLQ